MKIKALHLIVTGKGQIEPNTEIDLDTELAEELIQKGAAVAAADEGEAEEEPKAKEPAEPKSKAKAKAEDEAK